MNTNRTHPLKPNYTGPQKGWFIFLHHAQILEYSDNVQTRIDYVHENKPKSEQTSRSEACQVCTAIPKKVHTAMQAYNTARQAYDTARQACATTMQAYNTAWPAYSTAMQAYSNARQAYDTTWLKKTFPNTNWDTLWDEASNSLIYIKE